MLLVVEDVLRCGLPYRAGGEGVAGVRIGIKLREVTGRDFETNLMAGFEEVAGRPDVDFVLIDLSRDDRRGMGERVAVAGALDSVIQIDSSAVGEDVDEFGCEIGVGRRGRRVQSHGDGTGDFNRAGQFGRGVDADVAALFDGGLVELALWAAGPGAA